MVMFDKTFNSNDGYEPQNLLEAEIVELIIRCRSWVPSQMGRRLARAQQAAPSLFIATSNLTFSPHLAPVAREYSGLASDHAPVHSIILYVVSASLLSSLNMLPITPAPGPARPQKSSSRKLNEGAIEAANRSANPMSARHMATRANRNKQRSLLPDRQRLAPSVTKFGLRQSLVKTDDQIQTTTLGRLATASQRHGIPQRQCPAIRITPQLDGSTVLGKGEPLSPASRTPIKEAAILKKSLRVYQSVAKRQVQERRDVYQLPKDKNNSMTTSHLNRL